MRKAALINAGKARRHHRKEFNAKKDYDNMLMFHKSSKAGSMSMDDWAMKVLEEEGINSIIEASMVQSPEVEYGQAMKGTVVSVSSKGCCVVCDGQQYDCLIGPELFMSQKSDIAVGDQVEFAFAKDATTVVQAVDPRKSKLSRPDPTRHKIERVVAANIDVAVIVASIRQPILKPSLIDRYLIATQKGGIEAIICVNKIDLIEEADRLNELEVLAPYREIGIETIECSAQTGAGIAQLQNALRGRLCVFVGHSGTGKSSILNAINPDIDAQVGQVHEPTGLGRHTTTSSSLYEAGEDIRIIDTPGIREFGLWRMDAQDLKWYFDEFDQFAQSCRYSNCSHTHEPDCAVKQAVDSDEISLLRYESYLRILETLGENGVF